MIEQRGNKTWYRVVKSFYKIAKKGRVVHVVAAMAACLTFATSSLAVGFNVTEALTATQKITADGDTGTITNTGSIMVTNGAGRAVGVDLARDADNNITINNAGTISAATTGSNEAFGIHSQNRLENSIFTNMDLISASASEDNAFAIAVQELKNSTLMNSGTIDVSGKNVFGMYAGYGLYGTSCMENAAQGLITATSTTGNVYGLFSNYLNDNASIVNAGLIETISTADKKNYGIRVNYAQDDTVVSNSGVIRLENGPDSYQSAGISVKSLRGNSKIINSKTITIINNGSSVSGIRAEDTDNTASITNSGTITVTNNSDAAYYGTGIYQGGNASILNSGTIEAVDKRGVLGEKIFSIYSSGMVENSATGILKGRLNAGNTINNGLIIMPACASTVNGDFTQNEAGILGITLFSDGNPSNIKYTKLNVSGITTLAPGSGIDVDVTTAAEHQDLLIDETLTGVISSSGGINADTTALNVTDNSALLNFAPILSDTDKSLDLRVEKGSSILEATTDGGGLGVTGVAGTLDSLGSSAGPSLSVFIADLNTLATQEQVARRVGQAAPVTSTQTPAVASQIANTMSSVVQARQQSVRGFNSGDPVFSDKNIWIKPFGARMDQDDSDGINGFSAKAYGIGTGADGEYAPGQRFGLAFFYTRAKVDTNHVSQQSDLDVFNLMAYGSRPIFEGGASIFYQAGGGLQLTDSARYIQALGKTAKADFTAKNLFAQAKASKEFQLNQNLKIAAGALVSYAWFYNPAFEESGASGMSLAVESFDSNSLVTALEGDLSWTPAIDFEVMVSASLGYDLINDNTSVSSRFQGAGNLVFETRGMDKSPIVYSAGIGIARKLTDVLSFDAKYDIEGRGSDFMGHMVSAKVNWKF